MDLLKGTPRAKLQAPRKTQRVKKPPKENKKASVKKQIRSMQRLLNKEDLDIRIRKAGEEKLESLKEIELQHKQARREKKYAIRYHMVKFFERVKIERSIEKLKREAKRGKFSTEDAVKLAQQEEDLQYVKFFPKGEKYVSLLKDADEPAAQAVLQAERQRLRALVRQLVADQAMLSEVNEGRQLTKREDTQEADRMPANDAPASTAVGDRAIVTPNAKRQAKQQEGKPTVKRLQARSNIASSPQHTPKSWQNSPVANTEEATGLDMAEEDDFFLHPDAEEPAAVEVVAETQRQTVHQPSADAMRSGQERTRPKRKQERHKPPSIAIAKAGAYKGSNKNATTRAAPKPERTRAEGGRKRRKTNK